MVFKKFNKLSIGKRLFLLGYFTLTPVFILVAIMYGNRIYSSQQKDRQISALSNATALAESLDVIQNEVKDISTYLLINDQIGYIMSGERDAEILNKNARLWYDMAPMQIIQDMISVKGYIMTIAIYPANGVDPYLRGMDGSVYVGDSSIVLSSPYFKMAHNSKNHLAWIKIGRGSSNIFEYNLRDKLVLFREDKDLSTGQTQGAVIIGVDYSKIEKMCADIVDSEDEGVAVFTNEGNILVSAGIIPEDLKDNLDAKNVFRKSYKKKPSLIRCHGYDILLVQRSNSSAIVCKILPNLTTREIIENIYVIPLILLLGLLVSLFFALFFISRSITYAVKISEKESELKALEAQINPHFLFNTLDSLYWQAMDADNEDLAENIYALSQLFNHVLSNGNSMVSVQDEIELVSRFLQIEKMRFGERLGYNIELSDSIKNILIPKLIFEPFVENAVVHGFEKADRDCIVSVQVLDADNPDYILFRVRDNGIGMDNKTKRELLSERGKDPANYRQQRIGRFAIRNIMERLRMYYGDDFVFEVDSNLGEGTIITLTIPKVIPEE
ncbi:MAG: histidine kinase [Pseudobutyrivibrio sp.]|nr:histidine kinase [Pseudobutyrivibrio sp.]